MKFKTLLGVGAALWVTGAGAQVQLSYTEKDHFHDVFGSSQTNEAYFSLRDDYFKNWVSNGSGKTLSMDPAPGLTGLIKGIAAGTAPTMLNSADYQDQAREFVDAVNFRNQDGRPEVEMDEKTPEADLKAKLKNTHVVESVLSAVLDVPFQQINLDPSRILTLASAIDVDHFHFPVSGQVVLEALENHHSARAFVRPEQTYVLSAFDLRDYNCEVMENQINDYFSKRPERDRLMNGSIYVISDIQLNNAEDIEGFSRQVGRRPDRLISQKVIYASHLIRAANTYFAFYSEDGGAKTRVVLLSNIAMGSKFFTGKTGMVARRFLLNGVGSGVSGVVLDAKDAVSSTVDALGSLFSEAEEDTGRKNSCDKGLALGLTKYSQSLFTQFADYIGQN